MSANDANESKLWENYRCSFDIVDCILRWPAHLLTMKGGKIEWNVDRWRGQNMVGITPNFCEWKNIVFISILKGDEGKSGYRMGGGKNNWKTQYNWEKSCFDLDIEVRRRKSSCEMVDGRKTAEKHHPTQ